MNNSLLTVTGTLCDRIVMKQADGPLYKSIIDILYMAGTFLGGKFFGHVGKSHGRRFSLGTALFTTLIGTSLGLVRQIW